MYVNYLAAALAAAALSAVALHADDGPDGAGPVSADGGVPANCFVLTSPGDYFLHPLKGDGSALSAEPVGAEILWQIDSAGYCTGLIESCSYEDGVVRFRTCAPLVGGNALVAATDKEGNVLWSWHIWMLPGGYSECRYGDDIMMDRNLGALSDSWEDSGKCRLYWQWGRKDPFPDKPVLTAASDSRTGTDAYASSHPATFITGNSLNYGWLYTGCSTADQSRWAAAKTVNDPCPAGWRVPDGGLDGAFSRGGGMQVYASGETGLGALAGDGRQSWIPACGYLGWEDGILHNAGAYGMYWTAGCAGHLGRQMMFFKNGYQTLEHATYMSFGQSVRCQKEKSLPKNLD